jgi:hypothetical protein
MATDRQIAANRRNAQKSTGPTTQEGKHQSRQNAFRHGLTAQTVIRHLENASEYSDLEALIIADYEPQTTIERILVERLASLLWRLRRAVAIETGLFERRPNSIQGPKPTLQIEGSADPLVVFRNLLVQNRPRRAKREPGPNARAQSTEVGNEIAAPKDKPADAALNQELSRRFSTLANSDEKVLERIERYEVSLWRQTAQTMMMLNSIQSGLKFYGRATFRQYRPGWK